MKRGRERESNGERERERAMEKGRETKRGYRDVRLCYCGCFLKM